jgi:hypothetical protein
LASFLAFISGHSFFICPSFPQEKHFTPSIVFHFPRENVLFCTLWLVFPLVIFELSQNVNLIFHNLLSIIHLLKSIVRSLWYLHFIIIYLHCDYCSLQLFIVFCYFCDTSLITACAIFCHLKFHVVCTCAFFESWPIFGDTICLLTNRKMIKRQDSDSDWFTHWHCIDIRLLTMLFSLQYLSESCFGNYNKFYYPSPNHWVLFFILYPTFCTHSKFCLPTLFSSPSVHFVYPTIFSPFSNARTPFWNARTQFSNTKPLFSNPDLSFQRVGKGGYGSRFTTKKKAVSRFTCRLKKQFHGKLDSHKII